MPAPCAAAAGDAAGPALAPLCLLLRAASHRSAPCRRALLAPAAATGVLGPLLDWTAEDDTDGGEPEPSEPRAQPPPHRGDAARWLSLLAADLCGERGRLAELLEGLEGPAGGGGGGVGVGVRQGVLLHLLAEALEERAHGDEVRGAGELVCGWLVHCCCPINGRMTGGALNLQPTRNAAGGDRRCDPSQGRAEGLRAGGPRRGRRRAGGPRRGRR